MRPHHPAVVFVERAEENRLRRTRLGTRSLDVAAAQCLAVGASVNLRFTDPLDAEGALFHDAALADGHVRVSHQRLSGDRASVEIEPVEPAHFVRTVVRTE